MTPQPNNTLHSLILTLVPHAEAHIPATMGQQAHGAFLHTIRQADAELAQALHARNQVRPFTVSALSGAPPAQEGRLTLSPEAVYRLRFTTLGGDIFQRFMARFLDARGRPTIRLGRATLGIHQILATPEGHDWAGYTTWADLLANARPHREITLAFYTPTAFGFGQKEWGKKTMVLPLPQTVFGSLIKRWNALAPAAHHLDRDTLRGYLEEHVVVSRLEDLHTRMLRFRRARQIGFLGRVTYRFMGGEDDLRRQLDALADFAFYSGVGMKTTMGMGQCRRVAGED
jgi:CRISPR-associated endoribonuclease Cas6